MLFLKMYYLHTVYPLTAITRMLHLIPPTPLKKKKSQTMRGAWVAQLVERPTSTQVMISQSVSSSPVSGSVLTAQSLEPVSDSVFPSLSAPPLLACCLPLSQK